MIFEGLEFCNRKSYGIPCRLVLMCEASTFTGYKVLLYGMFFLCATAGKVKVLFGVRNSMIFGIVRVYRRQ